MNLDNPSGQCLPAANVRALAALAEERGKRVVLDESFVDFAAPEHCDSLLTEAGLDRFPSWW